MVHELPDLPYDFNALEPYIDELTMKTHHGKHHAGYVKKLNVALENTEFADLSIEELMQKVGSLPEDLKKTVLNNGGGHFNHSLFWTVMASNSGGEPSGKIADAINKFFGSFDEFKEKFSKAALGVFGSGWVWLTVSEGRLQIETSPNQDLPLGKPILCLDVWEHSYYLRYLNKRFDYVAAWWNVVNWVEVNKRYEEV